MTRIVGFAEESLIFVLESLYFDNEKLHYNI